MVKANFEAQQINKQHPYLNLKNLDQIIFHLLEITHCVQFSFFVQLSYKFSCGSDIELGQIAKSLGELWRKV